MKIPTFLYETVLEQRDEKSLHVENCKALRVCFNWAFNNYVGKILSFLNPPCPAWTVLIPRAWTLNKPFFDSLPPHFVQVVIEWPLIQLKMDNYP